MVQSVKLEDHEQYSLRNTIHIIEVLQEKYPDLYGEAVRYCDCSGAQVERFIEEILAYF